MFMGSYSPSTAPLGNANHMLKAEDHIFDVRTASILVKDVERGNILC